MTQRADFPAEQKPGTFELITDKLAMTAQGLQFGEIGVVCKIHNGQIVKTTYSRTENTQTTFPG